MAKCLYCHKEMGRAGKYCNTICQQAYLTDEYIQNWKAGNETGLVGQFGVSKRIRNYMLKKANFKCERCGWGETNPFTDTLPLELHHKDGDYRNNVENNLEILCPNCHSLTANFKGANQQSKRNRDGYISRKNYCIDCGISILSTSTRCSSCESKIREQSPPISRDELKILIRRTAFTQIAKKFNVSDNTIRKWCDKYNLPRKASDIKKITDTDWELI